MGDPLSNRSLESFSDELQKMARFDFIRRIGQRVMEGGIKKPIMMGARGLNRVGKGTQTALGGVDELAKRLRNPIQGLRKGWQESSPLPALERRAKEMGFGTSQEAAAALKSDPSKYKKLMAGGGEHLLGPSPQAGPVRSAFENLSRGGWTGAGKMTKYLPVGNKGLTVGMAASAIPNVAGAEAPTPTGEGAAVEQGLGELGLGLTTVLSAGSGIGLVPAMGLMYAGQKAGNRLGRIVDRVRSGASVKDAVSAPSPTEAVEQAETIQRYYG